MIKKIFILILLSVYMHANVHYAKVEPYESVVIKSSVSGLVIKVDLDAEGTTVHSRRVIYLDDYLDKINLKSARENLFIVRETLKRQEEYFKRIDKLKTASKTQKDNAFYNFSSTKTKYLDIQTKIAQLEDTIAKKTLVLENKYLYKLMVRKGDFVNPGTPLAEVKDASRAKLVLFLEPEELNDIEQKIVYLNGEKTEYKVNKVWKVADEKFISSYRAEIYMSAPSGVFSKLMKVEIK